MLVLLRRIAPGIRSECLHQYILKEVGSSNGRRWSVTTKKIVIIRLKSSLPEKILTFCSSNNLLLEFQNSCDK